jgi:pimeloyl-ACP methyl ester carboxylesterase
MNALKILFSASLLSVLPLAPAYAQITQRVLDMPSRPGLTQRMIVLTPPDAKAAVVILAGGHGGLQIAPDGTLKWGNGNFLVRTRQQFAEQGLLVAVIDAPSDRQSPPFLNSFRQTSEHVADLKIVIAWLRDNAKVPVWLVGTSRGTQSAAFIATELSATKLSATPNRLEGPDGIVLSSTILTDHKSRPVSQMPLAQIHIPVLVIHHEQDGCSHCAYADTAALMGKFVNAPRKQLLSFKGGENRGDPCEAFAYHGFNGLEREVVAQTAAWILAQ